MPASMPDAQWPMSIVRAASVACQLHTELKAVLGTCCYSRAEPKCPTLRAEAAGDSAGHLLDGERHREGRAGHPAGVRCGPTLIRDTSSVTPILPSPVECSQGPSLTCGSSSNGGRLCSTRARRWRSRWDLDRVARAPSSPSHSTRSMLTTGRCVLSGPRRRSPGHRSARGPAPPARSSKSRRWPTRISPG